MPEGGKTSALKGKGGLVAMVTAALLLLLLIADFRAKPPREEGSNPPVSDYVHAESKEVVRVEVKRPENPFVLVKQGEEWRFESPRPYRANSESVNSWLRGVLEDATVNRVVKEKVTDLSPYGFDKPRLELILTRRGGDVRTLQIGSDFTGIKDGSASTNPYYAREVKDGRLFMLSAFHYTDLRDKKIEDLRDRRLVAVPEAKDVRKVTAVRGTAVVELERRKPEGEKGQWALSQPFSAPADDLDAGDLVSQLRDATGDRFVEDDAKDLARYGLDRPTLTVTVLGKSGPQTVRFGKKDREGNVYAAREGSTEVLLVSKTTFDNLAEKASPSSLRDGHLVTLETDDITYLEITNRHGNVRLQKSGDGWQFVNPADPKKKKAKADQVSTILNTITASASKHVEEAPNDLGKYGLDKPAVTVTVNDGKGKSQVFQIGKKTGTGYYARGVPNAVFEVQDYVYRDLDVKAAAFEDSAS